MEGDSSPTGGTVYSLTPAGKFMLPERRLAATVTGFGLKPAVSFPAGDNGKVPRAARLKLCSFARCPIVFQQRVRLVSQA